MLTAASIVTVEARHSGAVAVPARPPAAPGAQPAAGASTGGVP